MYRAALLSALCLACGGKSPEGTATTGAGDGTGTGTGAVTGAATGVATGSATGSATGTATGGTTDVFSIAVLAPNQTCDLYATGASLGLTGESQRIAVMHQGIPGPVCAEWTITAVGTRSTGTIEVSYTDDGTGTCSTQCPWALSYILHDVPEGTWEVVALTETGTVDVLP